MSPIVIIPYSENANQIDNIADHRCKLSCVACSKTSSKFFGIKIVKVEFNCSHEIHKNDKCSIRKRRLQNSMIVAGFLVFLLHIHADMFLLHHEDDIRLQPEYLR